MNTEERFFAKVRPAEWDECWEWTATTNPKGYGAFSYRGRMVGAHRWAWNLFRGAIPTGLQIDHRCDNPPCVNPWHFDVVTNRVNCQRKRQKHNNRLEVCKQGVHRMSEHRAVTPDGSTYCRPCDVERQRRYREAKRGLLEIDERLRVIPQFVPIFNGEIVGDWK